jgi:ribonuclease R
MINDHDLTTVNGETGESQKESAPASSEKTATKHRRRRTKQAQPAKVKSAEGAEGKEQQEKQKPKKARRRSRPNRDVSLEDPAAAIRQRIFEIDDGDVSEGMPPILPILPEWSGSAPVRGNLSVKQVKKVQAPRSEEQAAPAQATARKSAKKAIVKDDANLQQAILDCLAQAGIPQSPEALLGKLAVPAMDFFAALDVLEASGQLFTTKKHRVALPSQLGYITGRIHITSKGFGFLTPSDGSADVFVAQRDLNSAMHGDLAVLKLTGSGGHSRDGEIVAVIERARKALVGRFVLESGSPRFIPDDAKAGGPYPAINLRRGGAKDGQKVVCEMDYDASPITARVTEVLGWPDEAGTDVLSIIRAHDIPEQFPRTVKIAARRVPEEISEDDILRREDLRRYTIVTIDGRDAKDFDDAISLDKLQNGNYLLGVHIADVAHYVKEGGALDKEALRRGTSVYFVDRVIPMLPEELSNGICSLNPNEDRLTLSCFMEIDQKGNVLSHRLSETVIRSSYRLVYKDVTQLLEGNARLRKKYQAILPMLTDMAELYEILNRRRIRRGSLEFDLPECKITLDEKGRTADVSLYDRGIANRIIEEFMLVCNETVAEHMAHLDLPILFRVHETPDPERVTELAAFLAGFGLTLRGLKNGLHPKSLQSALSKVEGRPEESIVSRVALRSLKKARYAPENLGHFGLAAEHYCHFTSPIRRYPDLVVHRVVKEQLRGKMTKKRLEALAGKMSEFAEQSSERERAAMEAEREVDDLKKCEYMAAHMGERFTGVISGVTSFGLFVELPNTCEGLVRIAEMSDDYYVYEEKNYRYVGRHRGSIYRLGDTVTIEVLGADPATRRVDFTLIPNHPPKGRHPKKGRGGSRRQ